MTDPGGPGEPAVSADETSQLTLPLWNNGVMKLDSGQAFGESEITLILQHLFSEDFETRQKAMAYLNINKHVITGPLVDILVKNTTHHTLVFQITYALEIIGKFAVPELVSALNRVGEIKTPLDLTIIENISETLIRINDNSAALILAGHLRDIKDKRKAIKKSIEQIIKPEPQPLPAAPAEASAAGQESKPAEPEKHKASEESLRKKLEFYQACRIKIHYLLGEMDSSEGLGDLLKLLGDGTRRVPGEIIETLHKIGTKAALLPLLRMYPVEAGVSELGARYIKLTCREIIRREKISKSDMIFQNLAESEKDTCEKILAGHKNGSKG